MASYEINSWKWAIKDQKMCMFCMNIDIYFWLFVSHFYITYPSCTNPRLFELILNPLESSNKWGSTVRHLFVSFELQKRGGWVIFQSLLTNPRKRTLNAGIFSDITLKKDLKMPIYLCYTHSKTIFWSKTQIIWLKRSKNDK